MWNTLGIIDVVISTFTFASIKPSNSNNDKILLGSGIIKSTVRVEQVFISVDIQ